MDEEYIGDFFQKKKVIIKAFGPRAYYEKLHQAIAMTNRNKLPFLPKNLKEVIDQEVPQETSVLIWKIIDDDYRHSKNDKKAAAATAGLNFLKALNENYLFDFHDYISIVATDLTEEAELTDLYDLVSNLKEESKDKQDHIIFLQKRLGQLSEIETNIDLNDNEETFFISRYNIGRGSQYSEYQFSKEN